MFWYLFIFRRHSPRELAYIACDYEQGGLVHGRIRKIALIKINPVKRLRQDLKTNEENKERKTAPPPPPPQKKKKKKEKKKREKKKKRPGNWTRKNLLAVSKACVAIFRHTPGCKGRTFISSGFLTDENIIYASALPHCGLIGLIRRDNAEGKKKKKKKNVMWRNKQAIKKINTLIWRNKRTLNGRHKDRKNTGRKQQSEWGRKKKQTNKQTLFFYKTVKILITCYKHAWWNKTQEFWVWSKHPNVCLFLNPRWKKKEKRKKKKKKKERGVD